MRKKGIIFKVLGLVGAVFLVAFGGVKNFWRTVRLALERISKN